MWEERDFEEKRERLQLFSDNNIWEFGNLIIIKMSAASYNIDY